jgi:undecaprenyl-diphosphatase
MNLFQTLVLGIVEGITEYLPISSTAHLVLTARFLGILQTEFIKTFEIAIQLGAILAVVVLYWRRFLVDKRMLKNLIVAFIPASVVGIIFYQFIKNILIGNYTVTLWALFIGGFILVAIERFLKSRKQINNFDNLTVKQSFIIGIFQSVSVIPGVSRAAATIIGGLLTGLNRESATEFSFLLAVPTMLAATGLDLVKSYKLFTSSQFLVLGVGFIVAFITAILTIKFLLNFIKKHDFTVFGVYRIILAVLYWFFLMR